MIHLYVSIDIIIISYYETNLSEAIFSSFSSDNSFIFKLFMFKTGHVREKCYSKMLLLHITFFNQYISNISVVKRITYIYILLLFLVYHSTRLKATVIARARARMKLFSLLLFYIIHKVTFLYIFKCHIERDEYDYT